MLTEVGGFTRNAREGFAHFLRVTHEKMSRLAIIRALAYAPDSISISVPPGLQKNSVTAHLKHQPLHRLRTIFVVLEADLFLQIVLPDNIHDHRTALPDREVIVVMIDKRWKTPVRADIDVRCLFDIVEIEEDGVIGEPKLLEDGCDFPRVGARSVGVEGELFSMV